MKVTPWIAWRYFLSKRVGRFGPLLTIVAIASVAIGIFSLAVVMSVMRGFKAELGGRMMGFNSHITITAESEGVVLNDSILKSILKDCR